MGRGYGDSRLEKKITVYRIGKEKNLYFINGNVYVYVIGRRRACVRVCVWEVVLAHWFSQ